MKCKDCQNKKEIGMCDYWWSRHCRSCCRRNCGWQPRWRKLKTRKAHKEKA